MRLDQDVDHVAVLVDGPPRVLLLAIDFDEDFVPMPGVSQPALAPLPFPNLVGTEFLAPQPNRLIRDHDSPLGQQIRRRALRLLTIKTAAIADRKRMCNQ
jgi:hypothetical protein